jgi:ABC-type nitrate/sulfonate/bicarbonate transport system permease component
MVSAAKSAGAKGLGYLVVLALIGLWEGLAELLRSPSFPPFHVVVQKLVNDWIFSAFVAQGVPSLERLGLGLLLGFAAGVLIGLLIGLSNVAYALLEPMLEFLRCTPPVAILPIALLVLGPTNLMKVLIIAFGVLFPVLVNSATGAHSVLDERLQTAAVFGLSRWDVVRRVILPSALPMVVAGMRIAVPIGLIMVVVSEMVGASNGIGWYLMYYQTLYQTGRVLAAVVVLGIIGHVCNSLLVLVERRYLFWAFA